MSAAEVLLSHEAQGVAVLTLNRPALCNALNMSTRLLLASHLGVLAEDPKVACIIICGGDSVFATSADINTLEEKTATLRFSRLWQPFERCPKPVIACVAGDALGAGFELALMCDLIIAADTARFGLPEVRLGIMPGSGGTLRLTHLVGRHTALRLLLTGSAISAKRAYELGIVTDLVTLEALWPTALALAGEIAVLPRRAVNFIKETVQRGLDLPLQKGLSLERRLFRLLLSSYDQEEEMAALLAELPADSRGGNAEGAKS